MKNRKGYYISFCITFFLIITPCIKGAGTNNDILHLEGVTWACNLTTSYGTFGSSSEIEEQPKVVLPASDGDLLYMVMDDQNFYYRYSKGDGKHLVVTFDTLNARSVTLNGNLKSIELSDPDSWEFLKGLKDRVLKQLSTLLISGPVTHENLSVLKQCESSIRGTGLLLSYYGFRTLSTW